MRLVIVGCGGFIGSHLLDRLLQDDTISIDGWDPQTGKIARHLSNPRLRLRRSALTSSRDLADFRRAARTADAVINLAAICNPSEYNLNPIATIHSNFLEPLRIVDICAAQRVWLIHFSTSEVYGRTIASYAGDADYSDPALYELDEDATPLIMGPIRNQRWSYASAKQLMERYIFAQHKQAGLPFTIVRPLNFLGPRMDYIPGYDGQGVPRVLACFMTALLSDQPMRLVDGGTAQRTFVSIYDAVDALERMIRNRDRAANQIFNIGNRHNEVSMRELAELMREAYAACTGDPSYNSHPITFVTSRDFYGEGYEDCDRRMPNVEKAHELLGWRASMPLREMLFETVRHYYFQYRDWPDAPQQARLEDVTGV